MSIYRLKPAFQSLLRPVVARMHSWGVTANQVTVAACVVSIGVGLWLFLRPSPRLAFVAIPVWMFLRMALNAMDGMLAREFGQRSSLGVYLNELADVISDAALMLPFVTVLPQTGLLHGGFWVGLAILLAATSEFAGVLGLTIGASRRYCGPMGKSDRAFVLGVLGLVVALTARLPSWLAWLMPLVCLTTAWTIFNRVRNGLREAAAADHQPQV